MNTLLIFLGALAAFWASNELVIRWNEPFLGFLFNVLFAVLLLGGIIESVHEMSEPIKEARKRVSKMRGKK